MVRDIRMGLGASPLPEYGDPCLGPVVLLVLSRGEHESPFLFRQLGLT